MTTRMHPEDLRALMAASILAGDFEPYPVAIQRADRLLSELQHTATPANIAAPCAWTDPRVADLRLSLAHARNVIADLECKNADLECKLEASKEETKRAVELFNETFGSNESAKAEGARQERERIVGLFAGTKFPYAVYRWDEKRGSIGHALYKHEVSHILEPR